MTAFNKTLKCGDVGIGSDIIDAKILPHKLSLSMGRRSCVNIDKRACRQNQPPRADYPRYASTGTSYADMINYDIKVPSEHTIRGKRFDAEVQMFHIHPIGYRLSSIGVLIEARDGRFNQEFQDILDALIFGLHSKSNEILFLLLLLLLLLSLPSPPSLLQPPCLLLLLAPSWTI